MLAALLAITRRSSCTFGCDEAVLSIAPLSNALRVVTTGQSLQTESVIVATG